MGGGGGPRRQGLDCQRGGWVQMGEVVSSTCPALLVIKISILYKAEKDSGFLPATTEALQNWPIGTAWVALGAGCSGAREVRRAVDSPGNYTSDGPHPGVAWGILCEGDKAGLGFTGAVNLGTAMGWSWQQEMLTGRGGPSRETETSILGPSSGARQLGRARGY